MTGPAEPFQIHTSLFEGTLVELHRQARAEDIDLLELAVTELVHSVLVYLFEDPARVFDLESAGNYLFELACLVELKSRKLLPKNETETLLEDEEEEFTEEELEQRLARRLLDYARYRAVAEGLRGKEEVQRKRFFKMDPPDPTHKEAVLEEVSLYDMLKVLRKLLERAPKVTELEVTMERMSVADGMRNVLSRLKKRTGESTRFVDLFEGSATRPEIIVTFLAVLELIFRHKLRLSQDAPFSDIMVRLREDDPQDTAPPPPPGGPAPAS